MDNNMGTASLLFVLFYIAYGFAQNPQVDTKYGKVQGVTETVKSKLLTKFLGIPFAKPPVGNLRLKKPEKMLKWNDVKIAANYSASCYETKIYPRNLLRLKNVPNSEDCLYLNVFIPGSIADAKASPKAVMFWIHGGGWVLGNANSYPGENLALAENIIVVTSNYRVGLFGFMCSDDGVIPGNVGLFDQNAALVWVNENIEAFGGDASRITIFGVSAGAGSVYSHLVSPVSNNLFARAIIQSTPVMKHLPTKEIQYSMIKELTRDACPSQESSEKLLQCLQQLPAEKLLEISDSAIFKYYKHVCIDGEFLPQQPGYLMSKGEFDSSRDVIVGFMSDDGDLLAAASPAWKNMITNGLNINEAKAYIHTTLRAYFAFDNVPNRDMIDNLIYQNYFSCEQAPLKLARAVIDMLTDSTFMTQAFEIANSVAMYSGNVYLYEFAHGIDSMIEQLNANVDLSGGHASDIFYVFGYSDVYEKAGIEITENEKKLTISVMKAFAEFSRTGKPVYITNSNEVVAWNPYSTLKKQYLKFNDVMTKSSVGMVPKSLKERTNFWTYVVSGIQNIDTCDALITKQDIGRSSKGSYLNRLNLIECFFVVMVTLLVSKWD